jgi:Ala-tRNA(Pro) deacylase
MPHSDRPDPENILLENGKPAATPMQVLSAIESLGFDHHTFQHEPLYTVEEAKRVKHDLPGAHTKNLFLRNKKGRMFLLVIEQNRQVDLKGLRETLNLPGGQIAFASTERLAKYLGVVPGSVSPLIRRAGLRFIWSDH